MSHFTILKTKFTSAQHLERALADVAPEFGLGEVRENAVVRGFSGNTTRADLVVATRNAGYDLGFRKEGDTYSLVADWWGIRDFQQAQLTARLEQRYAYHAVRDQLAQQGFALVEEQVQQNQTVHLLLRRVV